MADAPHSSTPAADQATLVARALMDTVRWLLGWGCKVYLLEQVPEIEAYSSRKLFIVRGGQAMFTNPIAEFASTARRQVERRQAHAHEALRVAAENEGATIVFTHELLGRVESCGAWFGSRPAYCDNNHTTSSTSNKFADFFTHNDTV
jgi:hypothetical protein